MFYLRQTAVLYQPFNLIRHQHAVAGQKSTGKKGAACCSEWLRKHMLLIHLSLQQVNDGTSRGARRGKKMSGKGKNNPPKRSSGPQISRRPQQSGSCMCDTQMLNLDQMKLLRASRKRLPGTKLQGNNNISTSCVFSWSAKSPNPRGFQLAAHTGPKGKL